MARESGIDQSQDRSCAGTFLFLTFFWYKIIYADFILFKLSTYLQHLWLLFLSFFKILLLFFSTLQTLDLQWPAATPLFPIFFTLLSDSYLKF